MNALQSNIIREITPLSDKDCFYIAERYKTEFTYPIHNHAEFELNFTEKAAGVRRIVGDSAEVISDYDLVLITGKDLEHVWEQHDCHSKEIREITIQFSSDLFFKSFINKNQFDSIRDMLEKAQKGLCFPMSAILKIYPLLDTLASEKQGFYAVIKFLTILYELSLFNEEARTLSSSSFAKIGIHSDSRRVQKVQEYINAHYQEEIRLNQLADMPRVNIGLLHLLLQHTSASLTLNENCDPTVRHDMERFFLRAVPDNGNYEHDYEGADDMPSHIKSSMLGTSLVLPVHKGRIQTGTWQGIWLGVHRIHGGSRRIIATLQGE